MKQKLVIFSGAGISAESGIKTFRGSDGLWENYRIEEVATPEAFETNPKLVLEFYNQRRKQVLQAKPNAAHYAIAEAEKHFEVSVITQNIDDLHERAGSTNVIHLHGEIRKCRPINNPTKIHTIRGTELNLGETDSHGIALRPHVVWFGESVPMMDYAIPIIESADVFIVVGTSLNVYPAAGLIHFAKRAKSKYIVDPNKMDTPKDFFHIEKNASEGLPDILKDIVPS